MLVSGTVYRLSKVNDTSFGSRENVYGERVRREPFWVVGSTKAKLKNKGQQISSGQAIAYHISTNLYLSKTRYQKLVVHKLCMSCFRCRPETFIPESNINTRH